jgi:hypothetical protein
MNYFMIQKKILRIAIDDSNIARYDKSKSKK